MTPARLACMSLSLLAVSFFVQFSSSGLCCAQESSAAQADVPAQQEQAETKKPIKKLILPGESFLIGDRPAFVLMPEKSKQSSPQPWIMYAPTLPGIPDIHEKWMHEQFLRAGVAVAGIDSGESYGSPTSRKAMTELWQELTGKRGFAKRVCLLGRSRGGLFVSSWAIENPEKVSGLAGIYPVFDLRSYPGIARAAAAYKMTPAELEKAQQKHNPVFQADKLASSKIPVYLIHGDVDKVVPLETNSQALVEAYKGVGASDLIDLTVAKGQGHNFFKGFFNDQKLVDFATKQAKIGAGLGPQIGFQTIFDGRSLKGWSISPEGTEENWSANGSILLGKGEGKQPIYLSYHDDKLKDFELKLSFRLKGKGNAGIQFRVNPVADAADKPSAYTAVIGPAAKRNHVIGSLKIPFNNANGPIEMLIPRGIQMVINEDDKPSWVRVKDSFSVDDLKDREWHELRVVAAGAKVELHLNGKSSAGFIDNSKAAIAEAGKISLRLDAAETEIEFKDIRLKKN